MRSRALRLMGGQRTVLWDSFTDTDNTLMPEHNPDDGSPWRIAEISGGRGKIVNNRVQSSDGITQARLLKQRRRWRPNGKQRWTITYTGGSQNDTVGMGFRYNDGASFFVIGHYAPLSGLFLVARRQGGLETTVAQVTNALTQNVSYLMEVELRGPVMLIWINGAVILRTDGAIGPRRGGVFIRLGVNTATPPILWLDDWMATR